MTTSANTTYKPEVSNSLANSVNYAILQTLLNVNTMIPCKILAVNGLRYTVLILTNFLDSTGKPFTAPTIYDVPAMQLVGNGAGVIIEYAIGDVVQVGFCQRDISTVKQNWTQANPASYRKFSVSDGIILGYLSNTTPSVNITILSTGITINSNNTPVVINPGTSPVTINGDLVVTGTATIDTDAVIDGLSFNAHVHGPGSYNVAAAPVLGSSGIPI